ncbi:MAG TPA: class I SAM-dependent methyltransferase [Caldithrix abyssi]|uniref:Class I SAM-dependent methyltransferase n=1 Tax=Caldithrix abyssi TaxID=187145 RepID=A0A7V4U5H3_CALAY|nr:class I SAM-dependent methyltransferase [Caldithrix abyssi]
MGRRATFIGIEILNHLHFFYATRKRHIIEAKKSLLEYREMYDGVGYDIYDRIVARDRWLNNKTILDIGCFVGKKTERYLDEGAKEVIGIDLSKRGIATAKQFEKPGLRFFNISSSELARKYPAYFDTIVSFTVFEHISRESLPAVLEDIHTLLKKGGLCLIAFNHYLDRFGSHLANFIYHAHPTLLFNEKHVFEYCNRKLSQYHQIGQMGYYPPEYKFSKEQNSDVYLELNKVTSEDFKSIVQRSGLKLVRAVPYSQTTFMRLMNLLLPRIELFKGSYLYLLEK